jgi:arylsulfatase A-like enzyme
MTDKAIAWIGQQKALMPDKPFFVYFAPGATHAPHHVPKEWADKYKLQFDQGWDKLREETFARQKKLGVIPSDCDLTARHEEIFSADDGLDVGEDSGAPVSPDYRPRNNAFTGRVRGVQLAIAETAEEVDHLVSPEQAVHIALSRQ